MYNLDDVEYFVFTSKMPPWAMVLLKTTGIGPLIKMSDVTPAQKDAILNVEALIKLHKKGIIKVHYDPNSEEIPMFSLTPEGRKTADILKQQDEEKEAKRKERKKKKQNNTQEQ
jgi:hypothetical protein